MTGRGGGTTWGSGDDGGNSLSPSPSSDPADGGRYPGACGATTAGLGFSTGGSYCGGVYEGISTIGAAILGLLTTGGGITSTTVLLGIWSITLSSGIREVIGLILGGIVFVFCHFYPVHFWVQEGKIELRDTLPYRSSHSGETQVSRATGSLILCITSYSC